MQESLIPPPEATSPGDTPVSKSLLPSGTISPKAEEENENLKGSEDMVCIQDDKSKTTFIDPGNKSLNSSSVVKFFSKVGVDSSSCALVSSMNTVKTEEPDSPALFSMPGTLATFDYNKSHSDNSAAAGKTVKSEIISAQLVRNNSNSIADPSTIAVEHIVPNTKNQITHSITIVTSSLPEQVISLVDNGSQSSVTTAGDLALAIARLSTTTIHTSTTDSSVHPQIPITAEKSKDHEYSKYGRPLSTWNNLYIGTESVSSCIPSILTHRDENQSDTSSNICNISKISPTMSVNPKAIYQTRDSIIPRKCDAPREVNIKTDDQISTSNGRYAGVENCKDSNTLIPEDIENPPSDASTVIFELRSVPMSIGSNSSPEESADPFDAEMAIEKTNIQNTHGSTTLNSADIRASAANSTFQIVPQASTSIVSKNSPVVSPSNSSSKLSTETSSATIVKSFSFDRGSIAAKSEVSSHRQSLKCDRCNYVGFSFAQVESHARELHPEYFSLVMRSCLSNRTSLGKVAPPVEVSSASIVDNGGITIESSLTLLSSKCPSMQDNIQNRSPSFTSNNFSKFLSSGPSSSKGLSAARLSVAETFLINAPHLTPNNLPIDSTTIVQSNKTSIASVHTSRSNYMRDNNLSDNQIVPPNQQLGMTQEYPSSLRSQDEPAQTANYQTRKFDPNQFSQNYSSQPFPTFSSQQTLPQYGEISLSNPNHPMYLQSLAASGFHNASLPAPDQSQMTVSAYPARNPAAFLSGHNAVSSYAASSSGQSLSLNSSPVHGQASGASQFMAAMAMPPPPAKLASMDGSCGSVGSSPTHTARGQQLMVDRSPRPFHQIVSQYPGVTQFNGGSQHQSTLQNQSGSQPQRCTPSVSHQSGLQYHNGPRYHRGLQHFDNLIHSDSKLMNSPQSFSGIRHSVSFDFRPAVTSNPRLRIVPEHEKKFTCPYCLMIVYGRRSLFDHVAVHASNDPSTCRKVWCPYCKNKYMDQRQLVEHFKNHTAEEIG